MENKDEKQPELDLDEKIQVAEDDEPVQVIAKVEETASKDEVSPEEGIEALKKRLDEERKAREAAERRAYEAQQNAQRAQKDAQEGDLQLIVSAIAQTKQNAEVLKNGYAEAMSAGDYRRAADFQEAIAANTNKLSLLENGKASLETKMKQPAPAPVAPVANDPVERFASALTPRSAAWIRKNPDFVTNPAKYQKMIEGHNWAISVGGHIADTDSYFDAVEQYVGIKNNPPPQEEPEDVVSVAAAPVQKRTQSPPPAPSTRMASASSGKPNVIRLSSDQKEMASMMGMSPEEYAKNMVALRKEGKLN